MARKRFAIADCRLPIEMFLATLTNRKSKIENRK